MTQGQFLVQQSVPDQFNWRHGGIGSINERTVDFLDIGHQINYEDNAGDHIRVHAGTDAHPYGANAGDPLPSTLTSKYTSELHSKSRSSRPLALPRDSLSLIHKQQLEAYEDDKQREAHYGITSTHILNPSYYDDYQRLVSSLDSSALHASRPDGETFYKARLESQEAR